MKRSPDANSLDNVIPQSNRPIASYTDNNGQVISDVGTSLSKVASDQQEKQDKLEEAYAKSNLLQKSIEIKNSFKGDPDYSTYQPRYEAAMADVVKESLGMINNPTKRELFNADAGVYTRTSLNTVLEEARAQERNTGQANLLKALDVQQSAYQGAPDETSRTAIINTVNDLTNATLSKGYIEPVQAYTLQRKWAEGAAKANLMRLAPDEQNDILRKTIPGQEATMSPDISSAITKAAQDNGVDAGTLGKIAMLESGGNPSAQNPGSSAAGLFQFTAGTAKQFGLNNPLDANESANAAARLMSHNSDILQADLGRSPTPDELYLAHQQGAAGASALLQNPRKNAVSVLSDVYGSESKAERAITQNGGTPDMTAAEFSNLWKQKFLQAGGNDTSATSSIANFIPLGERVSLFNKNQAIMRTEVEAHIKDTISMAQDGKADPSPLQKQDFISAYGADNGISQYQDYLSSQQWARDINNVMTQTPTQQAATLAMHQPTAGEGYAEDDRRYQILQKAIVHVNQERQKDPMAWAIQNNIATAKPIDFSNVAELSDAFDGREAAATMLAKTYGVQPNLLTNDEAKGLSKYLGSLSINNKIAYISSLADGVTDPSLYRQTMQQIRPDSPVTAVAGTYVGLAGKVTTATHLSSSNEDVTALTVAQHLIQGEALLNPTKANKEQDGIGKEFPMPNDKEIRKEFDAAIGNAYAGNPQGYNETFQAIRAYYAAEAATQGKYDPSAVDTDIAQHSIKAVLGDVTDINGTKVIPPWGMSASNFHDVAFGKFNQIINDNGFDQKHIKWGDAQLINTGEPGAYAIKSGTGYLLDKKGAPIVLNINANDVPAAPATNANAIEIAPKM